MAAAPPAAGPVPPPARALALAQGAQKRRGYHVLRVLGAGTKACVKLARHASGLLVALKSIRKPGPAPPAFAGVAGQSAAGTAPLDAEDEYAAAEKEWRTECAIIARVGHHENLPSFIDAFETISKWYIVMEYCAGGDLLSRLLEIEHYSEKHAAAIMATICNAVMYLHRHGIAHRDLKPANLLLRDGSENAALCLVDFNAGYIVPEAADGQAGSPGGSGAVPQFVSKTSMQTVTGTPFYLAPEIVLGQAYSTAVDAWSLGCIAYQLLVGVTPFQGSASYEQLYAKILNADYTFPPDVPLSPLARDFVQCLLVADPGPRASAEQALAHPWIQTLVPHGYLMLLQQFNHEASPGVFPPPTRYEPPPPVSSASGRTGSAEWRLKQAALAVAGFPNGSSSGSGASPAWRMPSAEAGAAATALDAEFGRTLRTRWESRGRPGILQVPDAAVFEHEELFGFAGGDPSPASPVSAAPQSPQPDAPHPHTPPSHVVPLADSSDLPNLAPMRRALSQKLDAHAAELRAASTRLDANSAARPGAAAGAGAGGLLDPSSAAGPGPAEADRAPSGFQVFWSASGALYVNEAEKERLREAAEGEVSDEDEGEAVVQVHVTPPPPRVEAREGKISMLDAFGRAGPLWEWETEDKG